VLRVLAADPVRAVYRGIHGAGGRRLPVPRLVRGYRLAPDLELPRLHSPRGRGSVLPHIRLALTGRTVDMHGRCTSLADPGARRRPLTAADL